ncbi:hypothetical protein IPF37_02875 [bacterium]|nr:MAG: hypothetical protein IPF37_02875 [bacterium]
MKKLLNMDLSYSMGRSYSSDNTEQLSEEQREDLDILVRSCMSEKVVLCDDGRVLIFADPAAWGSVFSSAIFLGIAALFALYRFPKEKEASIIFGSGFFLVGSAWCAFDAIKNLKKKNKKTPWLVLDKEQIMIGEAAVSWDAVANTVCETKTNKNGSVTNSVVHLNNKKGVPMVTINALDLPIDVKRFCKFVSYYLSIQK